MIFHQFFHAESFTFTYLLASRKGGEALIIDPVREDVPAYVAKLNALQTKLVVAVDTHVHADHITGLDALRTATACATKMGLQSKADCVSARFSDGEILRFDGLELTAIYTPGHTDDSYSFLMNDRVFTGDTLLIHGTGRTDFQNGNARAQYDSLFGKLLALPDATRVFPAHDYNQRHESTIGEEKRLNPRLKVDSVEEYIELMGSLRLPRPRLMDVAVPANLRCGRTEQNGTERHDARGGHTNAKV